MILAGWTGALSGNTRPHTQIRGPHTGRFGTDIGGGAGVPGAGTSERSTGGGGVMCCGHPTVSEVAAAGWAVPGTAPSRIVAPSVTIRATTARDRIMPTGRG